MFRADCCRGLSRVALGVLLGLMGCTPWARPDSDPRADPECGPGGPAEGLPVLTTLVTREHEVTVHASDDGLRFTVALADGALLGRQLDAREFEQRFPTLHRRFDSAFADDELWLDASLVGMPSRR